MGGYYGEAVRSGAIEPQFLSSRQCQARRSKGHGEKGDRGGRESDPRRDKKKQQRVNRVGDWHKARGNLQERLGSFPACFNFHFAQ